MSASCDLLRRKAIVHHDVDRGVATRGGDLELAHRAVERPEQAYGSSDADCPTLNVVIDERRFGGAPISWGVCEVPGWGVMLPAARVLDEMRSLGISATELGAPGFLPRDPAALRAVLDRHGMRFIGGFVPVVLHDPAERAATMSAARETAALFVAAGGDMFVSAVVVDEGWSQRFELAPAQWDHLVGMLGEIDGVCDEFGLTHALHPHVGTLVETAADVTTVLERSDVRWTLDTGHLYIGGYDPVQFVKDAGDRVAHVHLKDVRAAIVQSVRDGASTIRQATIDGVFCPLGQGDVPIRDTIETLESAGYEGWYVLEQDTDLGSTEPEQGAGPIEGARASVDFLCSIS